MNEDKYQMALFKLMVLGPLTSRTKLAHGELKTITEELASKSYDIPGSKRCYLSPQTITRWYYEWRDGGFDSLLTKKRKDRGKVTLPEPVQTRVLQLKKENRARSLNTLLTLLQQEMVDGVHKVSRATLHRFLQKHNLSRTCLSDAEAIERRSFEAEYAGDVWQADVLHGPKVPTTQGLRKTYLASIMDDKSRLIVHAVFGFSETAQDIELCLKQAILKRGLPKRLLLDNGSAYRCKTFQTICAKLDIRIVYCRPYEPQGKGKQERFFRTLRAQFLNELDSEHIKNIDDLNARLWAWLDEIYHMRPHDAFEDGSTPLQRWRGDLAHVRQLGHLSHKIDDYFYHRVKRKIKKDGTASYEGKLFEVPYELCGQTIHLVVDPGSGEAIRVESLDGEQLGPAHPIDKKANLHHKRQRPETGTNNTSMPDKVSLVELAHQAYQKRQRIKCDDDSDNQQEK